ncbi:MAG: AMP-binding protein [Rhodospirillaceae bacterium]|nr:AMP-binding protein [Rhodospirillaceae bacterium]
MPETDLLHILFEEQADRTPDAVAIHSGVQQVTYRELELRANRLANLIRPQYRDDHSGDLPPDTLIGLCAERGPDTIASVLAILKAGAGWVPLGAAGSALSRGSPGLHAGGFRRADRAGPGAPPCGAWFSGGRRAPCDHDRTAGRFRAG